jgi:hypothetical protein
LDNLCFLVYVQRSGSTFFSALLNGYKEIGVSLSANLPGEFIDSKHLPIRSEADVDWIVKRLYEDIKFKSWKIGQDDLVETLRGAPFPLHFPQLLELILRLYFSRVKPAARLFVYKKGAFIYRVKTLMKMFPEAKFIYMYRDPRGVYNSQKHNRRSISNQSFATNPVTFCQTWASAMQIARSHESDPHFISVKYEDLVNDSTSVMTRVCNFLGIEGERTEGTLDYYNKVPAEQKHLHTLIKEAPRKDRINAWWSTLSDAEIWIIEQYTARFLKSYGYEFVNIKPDRAMVAQYFKFWRDHCVGWVLLNKFRGVVYRLAGLAHRCVGISEIVWRRF